MEVNLIEDSFWENQFCDFDDDVEEDIDSDISPEYNNSPQVPLFSKVSIPKSFRCKGNVRQCDKDKFVEQLLVLKLRQERSSKKIDDCSLFADKNIGESNTKFASDFSKIEEFSKQNLNIVSDVHKMRHSMRRQERNFSSVICEGRSKSARKSEIAEDIKFLLRKLHQQHSKVDEQPMELDDFITMKDIAMIEEI